MEQKEEGGTEAELLLRLAMVATVVLLLWTCQHQRLQIFCFALDLFVGREGRNRSDVADFENELNEQIFRPSILGRGMMT